VYVFSGEGRQGNVYRGQCLGTFFEEVLDKYLPPPYLVSRKAPLKCWDSRARLHGVTSQYGKHSHFHYCLKSYIVSVRDSSPLPLNSLSILLYKFLMPFYQYVSLLLGLLLLTYSLK
jgi:hypothetical protein